MAPGRNRRREDTPGAAGPWHRRSKLSQSQLKGRDLKFRERGGQLIENLLEEASRGGFPLRQVESVEIMKIWPFSLPSPVKEAVRESQELFFLLLLGVSFSPITPSPV